MSTPRDEDEAAAAAMALVAGVVRLLLPSGF